METANSPTIRLYSPGQIALASFLGAPVAACWFWSRNYRELGEYRRATQCLVWGTLGTVILLIATFFLPERFPNGAIPIGYTIGLYRAAQRIHGGTVASHLMAGGRLGSWWTVVWVSLVFLVVIIAILFGVVLLLPEAE